MTALKQQPSLYVQQPLYILTPVEVVFVPLHELVGEDVVRHDGEDGRAAEQLALAGSDALAQSAVGHAPTTQGLKQLENELYDNICIQQSKKI